MSGLKHKVDFVNLDNAKHYDALFFALTWL